MFGLKATVGLPATYGCFAITIVAIHPSVVALLMLIALRITSLNTRSTSLTPAVSSAEVTLCMILEMGKLLDQC